VTYAGSRRVYDADAHVMEPAGWLHSFVDPDIRPLVPPMDGGDVEFGELLRQSDEAYERRRSDAGEADAAKRELMSMPRKGWLALGGADPAERSVALDALGFELQVVYPTGSFPQVQLTPVEAQERASVGLNRGLATFCADDRRLLGAAYVPLHLGVEAACRVLDDAVGRGLRVAMVDMVPAPGSPSPSHPAFDALWSRVVEAGVLLSVHVGLDNGWRPIRPEFFDNGRELPHFRSDAPGDALSYMAIGYPAQLFLASLVFDGVFERFPTLKLTVAELGAVWVPGFLRHLDTSARAFRRLQDLSHLQLAPSEYIERQVRFTPFAGEPVGWMMEASTPALYCFSSDFPHHEGTDDPIGRFERTMDGVDDAAREGFYWRNLAGLLQPATV
jgi:predicted TIM-barrel fold metal-dependent hydrolase